MEVNTVLVPIAEASEMTGETIEYLTPFIKENNCVEIGFIEWKSF